MITPEQIAAPNTESAHQQALFCWLALERQQGRLLETEWLHHIPNGGERNLAVAGKLKAEGVKAGVWDLFLPLPRGGYHGLYIEMKKPGLKGLGANALSSKQDDFLQYLCKETHYHMRLCFTWLEAVETIVTYCSMERAAV